MFGFAAKIADIDLRSSFLLPTKEKNCGARTDVAAPFTVRNVAEPPSARAGNRMSKPIWPACLQIENLSPRHLNASLGRGVLFASDKQTVFLVGVHGDERWAVQVSPAGQFKGWRLEENVTHWHGLFVPDVEILVEPSSFFSEFERRPIAGDFVLSGGEVRFLFNPSDAMRPDEVIWSVSPGPVGETRLRYCYSQWKLVVRDEVGAYQTLFERVT